MPENFGTFNPHYNPIPKVPSIMAPYEFFFLFFDTHILRLLQECTNWYAKKRLELGKNRYKWHDLTEHELKEFLGMCLLMGIMKKPKLANYWCKDFLIKTRVFSEIMAKTRFRMILSNWCYCKNENIFAGEKVTDGVRVEVVESFLALMLKKFQNFFSLGENIHIDESICYYRGKLSFKVYNPLKNRKWGAKMWMMADSVYGYAYDLKLYSGRYGEKRPRLGYSIVKEFCETLKNKGHKVFVDRFYTSMELFQELKADGIALTGPIRKNSHYFPETEHIKKNEWRTFKKDGIILHQIHPRNKDVFIASTIYGTNIKRYKKVKGNYIEDAQVPEMSYFYNKFGHSVDKVDQITSYYAFDRKSNEWWVKFFFYLLEISITNSYVLYKIQCEQRCKRPMSSQDYRVSVVKALIIRKIRVPQEMPRFPHFPKRTETKKRGTCAVCDHKTMYRCSHCLEYLCAAPCFGEYHNK